MTISKLKYLLPFLFTFGNLKAQVNLVPNPSFEQYTSCPCIDAMVSFAEPWFIAWGSPDYFNACNNIINNCTSPIPMGVTAVPSNALGYQMAYDGQAYLGMGTRAQNNDKPQFREFIGVKLNKELSPEKTYCYSFFVSLADTAWFTGKEIQIAVSPNANFNALDYSEFGQVVIPNGNDYAFNKKTWLPISGNFTASGGEKYLFIGNFLDSSQCPLIPTGFENSIWTYVYLFVDMVSLYDCDKPHKPDIPNVFTPDANGVNDLWEVVDTAKTISGLWIYNRWGTKVYAYEGKGNIVWDGTYKGSMVSAGVYFYLVKYKNMGKEDEFENGVITVVH